GFYYQGVPTVLQARLRPSDYGFDIVVRRASTSVPLVGAGVTLWGVPVDHRHDTMRGQCLESYEGNTREEVPSGECPLPGLPAPRTAVRLPTRRPPAPLSWGVEVDSYETPEDCAPAEPPPPPLTGCAGLDFSPSLALSPTTDRADSPS